MSEFNVLDMANQYAEENDTDIDSLFKKPQAQDQNENQELPEPIKKSKRQPWVPNKDLLDGMDELTAGPVTYDKSEIKSDDDGPKKNISDENAKKDAENAKEELTRIAINLEAAKKRNGIKNLQIPPGQYHAVLTAAAADTDYERAQSKLDEILKEIIKLYPGFIKDWIDGAPPSSIDDLPDQVKEQVKQNNPVEDNKVEIKEVIEEQKNDNMDQSDDKTKITITSDNADEISFSQDDFKKVKESRTIELNIVETSDIEFSQIEELDTNDVDKVLESYQCKTNQIESVLPASKYKASFSGLTYTEVLDLTYATTTSDIESEHKKWTICFNHIKNPSIGPFVPYRQYYDPIKKKRITMGDHDILPNYIKKSDVHEVSAYEDFLRKTSYLDLNFMLWKILCATSLNQEILTVKCDCGKLHEHLYRPNDLLIIDSVSPVVLEEMEKTNKASTSEEIFSNYKSSMINTLNSVKLVSSGFNVVFGHLSAYDFLTDAYGIAAQAEEDLDEEDIVRTSIPLLLKSIKAFLIPIDNPVPGGPKYRKISGARNVLKVISSLDEYDWKTIVELTRMMIQPYTFNFILRDVVCPACKRKITIPIENVHDLLFMTAQSLAKVQVVLTKN